MGKVTKVTMPKDRKKSVSRSKNDDQHPTEATPESHSIDNPGVMSASQKAKPAEAEKRSLCFFDLPREIRDIIYRLSISERDYPYHIDNSSCYDLNYGLEDNHKDIDGDRDDQVVLAAHRQIRKEASPFFYAGRGFIFSYDDVKIHDLEAWLQNIGADNAKLIRDLQYCFYAPRDFEFDDVCSVLEIKEAYVPKAGFSFRDQDGDSNSETDLLDVIFHIGLSMREYGMEFSNIKDQYERIGWIMELHSEGIALSS